VVQIISPFSVYFNARLIFRKFEVWRLFTNFFFFGHMGACGAGVVLLFMDAVGRPTTRTHGSSLRARRRRLAALHTLAARRRPAAAATLGRNLPSKLAAVGVRLGVAVCCT
jgi:hypothetical protein